VAINRKKAYPLLAKASKKQHTEMVRDIFATIPEGYDLLNRILSLRRDVAWRRFAVGKMRFFKTNRLLDLATGTADLAMEAALAYPHIEIVALDFVKEMIVRGQRKIVKQGLSKRIQLLQADALFLPADDSAFDVASIAFGIRNIPERIKTLKEMVRVIAPGGQVMVLEMHLPENKYVRQVYRSYLNHFLPCIAGCLTKNQAAYNYLSDSIANFPKPTVFAGIMGAAGLHKIEQYPLTLGTTYLHIGSKA
jgi:demethylmenaquinone methyltransferase / 2-methoxy-6-polyprenyl-1,4-benzoquinol methylase